MSICTTVCSTPCFSWASVPEGTGVYITRNTAGLSQMVAVYDVVEIAGISYGMISKRLAYDLNRNHTM